MKLVPKEELAERLYKARKKMKYSLAKTHEAIGLPIQTLFNVEHKLHPNVSKGTHMILSEFILFAENDYIEPEYAPKRWSDRHDF